MRFLGVDLKLGRLSENFSNPERGGLRLWFKKCIFGFSSGKLVEPDRLSTSLHETLPDKIPQDELQLIKRCLIL